MHELTQTISHLSTQKIGTMIAYCMEDPLGNIENLSSHYQQNALAIINGINLCKNIPTHGRLHAQLRITALLPSCVLQKVSKYSLKETNNSIEQVCKSICYMLYIYYLKL